MCQNRLLCYEVYFPFSTVSIFMSLASPLISLKLMLWRFRGKSTLVPMLYKVIFPFLKNPKEMSSDRKILYFHLFFFFSLIFYFNFWTIFYFSWSFSSFHFASYFRHICMNAVVLSLQRWQNNEKILPLPNKRKKETEAIMLSNSECRKEAINLFFYSSFKHLLPLVC